MLDEKKLEKETKNSIDWIREYIRKSNSRGVVIGLSGGKDSATVLAMLVKAIKKENILAVAMPCNSNVNDLEDAKLIARTFDVELITTDLTSSYNELENEINMQLNNIEKTLNKDAKINIKPRLRMTTLYGIAQSLGYLVAGTGNLCEAMVRIYYKMGRQ